MDIAYLIWSVSPKTEWGPNGKGDYKTGDLATDYSRIEHRGGPDLPTLAELQVKQLELTANKKTPKWETLRDKRDQLLLESDWTQLLDAPIDAATQARWATYRQTLRDLPQTYPTPDDVVWPTPPK